VRELCVAVRENPSNRSGIASGYNTEQAYVDWIKRYIHFHGVRHPQEMCPGEGKAFLSHLAIQKRVATSTLKRAFCIEALTKNLEK